MSPLFYFGKYLLLLRNTFSKPEKGKLYLQRILSEMNNIGVKSLGIVIMISVFMGAVTTIQTSYQLVSDFISNSVIGSVVSNSTILELSPTITSLVLAGRVGSSIASEIGTMRVSEQIDALEVMGINSAGYLILPKIVAALFVIPMLVIISMFLSISGGILAGEVTNILSMEEFLTGTRSTFKTFTLVFSLMKAFTFAFVISSVPAYQGYYTYGGSLEVGQSSTKAVVLSCVFILFLDYLLAQLFL